MLIKRSAITITKVGNGYVVQGALSFSPFKRYELEPSESLVFNELGDAYANGDTGEETLVSFIAKHFADRPNSNDKE